MLEIRPNCELCDVDLPPHDPRARICTYECTFCSECVDTVLGNVCPNCGGGFQPRPFRPAAAWRPGTGLAHDPASTTRREPEQSPESIAELTARLKDIPPADR